MENQVDEIKKHLHYDPETGYFWWITPGGPRRKMDKPAGTKDKSTGYVTFSTINPKQAHRLAWWFMTGELPNTHIDHINGKRDDNRWCNLRLATRAENQQNRKINYNNKSGYPGVYWHAKQCKYNAAINANSQVYRLGSYNTPEEAYIAYWVAKQKLHSFNPTIRS